MCSFDSPGEPWTEEDYQNHYNQMDPEDAGHYQRSNALRSLSDAISILEEAAGELKQKRNAIALHHNFLS